MPLPKGFVLDDPAAATATDTAAQPVNLPAGFTLDNTASPQDDPAAADQSGAIAGSISGSKLPSPDSPEAYADYMNSGAKDQGFGRTVRETGRGLYESTLGPFVGLHQAGMIEAHQAGHPANNAAMYGYGVLKAMGKGLLDGENSEEDAAAEALARHEYMSAFGHHLAASIPMLGPIAGEIGAGLGTGTGEMLGGDPDPSFALARTTGKVLGLYAPKMLGQTVGQIKELIPPPPHTSLGYVGDTLERSFIGKIAFDPYRAEQLRQAEASYEATIASLEKSRDAAVAAAEQQARKNLGAALVNRADSIDAAQQGFAKLHTDLVTNARSTAQAIGQARTPTEIGEIVDASIASKKAVAQSFYDEVEKAAQGTPTTKQVKVPRDTGLLDERGQPVKAYDTIEQPAFEGGVAVDASGIKAIAQRNLDFLAERGQVLDPKKLGDLQGDLQAIIDGPDTLSYRGASGAASDLMEIGRQLDAPFPKLRAKITAEVTQELKRSTMASVKDMSPDLAKKLEAANEMWTDLHAKSVQDLVGRVKDGAPETVHQILTDPGTSIQDIQNIKKVVDPAAFKAMAARALSDIVEDAVKPRVLPKNRAVMNAQPVAFEQLGEGLARRIEELDRSGKLAELFPQTAQQLRDIAKIARENRSAPVAPKVPKLVKPDIPPVDVEGVKKSYGENLTLYSPPKTFSALMINSLMTVLGVGSVFHRDFATFSKGAVAAYGMYRISKMLVEPAGANLMLKYLKAGTSGNVRLAAQLAQQFAFAATSQDRREINVQGVVPAANISQDEAQRRDQEFLAQHPEYANPTTTGGKQYSPEDEAGIAAAMKEHGLSREETIQHLSAPGGPLNGK